MDWPSCGPRASKGETMPTNDEIATPERVKELGASIYWNDAIAKVKEMLQEARADENNKRLHKDYEAKIRADAIAKTLLKSKKYDNKHLNREFATIKHQTARQIFSELEQINKKPLYENQKKVGAYIQIKKEDYLALKKKLGIE